MELLKEIIEKAYEVHDLLETECRQEASYAIMALEEMLMELPAGVEDWADLLREEFSLFAQAREWMSRDPLLAIEKIEEAIERLERISQEASARDIAPEFPEDVGIQDAA